MYINSLLKFNKLIQLFQKYLKEMPNKNKLYCEQLQNQRSISNRLLSMASAFHPTHHPELSSRALLQYQRFPSCIL